MQGRNLILGVVLIGVLVGGYFVYDSSQSGDDNGNESSLSPTATLSPSPTPDPETEADIEAISDLYTAQYTKFIRDNDTDSLYDLYISRNLPLRITRKTTRGPYTSTDNISLWMGSTVGRIPDYEMITGEPFVLVDDGIAVSVGEFNELNGERETANGVDLFTYVKTPDGWKIVALTAVRTAANDPTDHSQAYALMNDIETIMQSLDENIREQNRGRFLVPFIDPTDPFVMVDGIFDAEFTVNEHSPAAFYDSYIADASAPSLVLENMDVHVEDQYVAYAAADYTLYDGDEILAQGRWISSFMATANYGWQITSTVLTTVG